jgi:hypothetical protein
MRDITPFGPAGSINASAADMARWLAFQLGHGRPNARPVQGGPDDVHPQIITPSASPIRRSLRRLRPGLGVTPTGASAGLHDGEIDGFKALASIMPTTTWAWRSDQPAGTPLPEIVAFQVYDRLLDLSPSPGASGPRPAAEAEKTEAARRDAAKKNPATPAPPTHALDEYAGTYAHPAFGEVVIAHRDGALEAILGGEAFPLIHAAYDMFRAGQSREARDRDEPAENLSVKFRMNDAGAIARLDIPLQPNAKDIVFTRVATGPGQPGPSETSGGAPQGATRP